MIGTVIGTGVFLKAAVMAQDVGTPGLVLAISAAFDQLTDFVIFGSFHLLRTAVALFVLRRKMADTPRPYRTLGIPSCRYCSCW